MRRKIDVETVAARRWLVTLTANSHIDGEPTHETLREFAR